MITIINISDTKFSYNGINYFKNFTPFVTGNKVSIVNTYDACISLTNFPTIYSDISVDGVTYGSVAALQNALLPVLYTRNSLTNAIIALTTTGNSGAATLVGTTLNIPNYTLAGLGGVAGSGTTNYIPKFTASGTIGNSLIYDNGSKIGVGTTTPAYKFSVYDTSDGIVGHFSGGVSNYTLISFKSNEPNVYSTSLGSYNSGLLFRTGATDRMYINSNGQVQISSPISDALKLTNTNSGAYNGILIQNDASNQIVLGIGGSAVGGTNQNRGYSGTVSNIDYYLMTNNTARLLVTSSGNVGIGTTSPSSVLHAVNSITNYTPTLTLTNTATDNGALVGVRMLPNNGSSGLYIGIHSTGIENQVAFINQEKNAPLAFMTNGTERMRITSGGDVLIGKTTSGWTLDGFQTESNGQTLGVTNSSVANNIFLRKNGTTGNVAAFYYGNVGVGSISITTATTSYNITSDYRLKEDFKPFNGLDLVSKIKVYDYAWKSDNSRMNGVIAHELQEVLPYAVTGEKDAEQMQQVDYSKLVPILVQAIQELKAEIEILKNK